MDREKARMAALQITDDAARQREISRIEGEYVLGLAVDHMMHAKTGKLPKPEESRRIVDAVQRLVYDAGASQSEEEIARRDYALRVLDAGLG